jgi:3-oxoacyl-[acyl-carrier-protein] synthase-3
MMEQLRLACKVDDEKIPIRLRDIGNTVSCTLPILINDLRGEQKLGDGSRHLLVGFGVGWSWAACIWQDLWQQEENNRATSSAAV